MGIEDRQRQRDIQQLTEGLDRNLLSLWDLWLKYCCLGGQAREPEVEAHVRGKVPLPEFERQLLRLAMNELSDEAAQPHAVIDPFALGLMLALGIAPQLSPKK